MVFYHDSPGRLTSSPVNFILLLSNTYLSYIRNYSKEVPKLSSQHKNSQLIQHFIICKAFSHVLLNLNFVTANELPKFDEAIGLF